MVFVVLYTIFILLFWGVFFIHIFRWCVFLIISLSSRRVWSFVEHTRLIHSFCLSVHKHPLNHIKNKFEVCPHVTIYRILISYLLIISNNYNHWSTWRLWIIFPLLLINSLVTCMMSWNSVLLVWEFLMKSGWCCFLLKGFICIFTRARKGSRDLHSRNSLHHL